MESSMNLFIILNIIRFSCILASTESECQTPNGTNGSCLPLRQCQPLFSLLLTSLSDTQRQFLRQSQCGINGQNPLVCCPTESKFTTSDLPPPGQCGKLQSKEAIFLGGRMTFLGDYPWLALIHYTSRNAKHQNNFGFYCDGVLISSNYVLTAAHCIQGLNFMRNNFSVDLVRLGENNLNSEPDCDDDFCADPVLNVPVAETIVHESYSPGATPPNDDIALIRLAQSVKFTDFVSPICLPIAQNWQNNTFDDAYFTVIGFDGIESASRSDVKLHHETKAVNLDRCNRIYAAANITVDSNHICAGGEDKDDTCTGDSGGPIMAETSWKSGNRYRYLVGIESFGPRVCGTPGFPAVYTKVDQYIDWILDHMTK